MKVKKFIASSMPEAMKLIRTDLGDEAVILNSKIVKSNGLFGFFKKSNIEVIAAIDPGIEDQRKPVPIEKESKSHSSKLVSFDAQLKSAQENFNPITNEHSKIIAEIKELKSFVTGLNSELYPEPIQKINRFLIEQEVSSSIRKEILESLLGIWNSQQIPLSDLHWLEEAKSLLLKKISCFEHGGLTFEKKYLNVVGPTGVGKTTTLAKIAAECILNHQKTVAFITTDTFRIAAIEQLKTYAKILNAPIEVAYNHQDFLKAKEKLKVYDIVLIDTAGRNYRNQTFINDLTTIIGTDEQMETYLVLSLTSNYKDMSTIYDQFTSFKINKIIFSKTDETSTFGPMANLIIQKNTGVAYLTTGQHVPDDILVATNTVIIDTLFGEYYE